MQTNFYLSPPSFGTTSGSSLFIEMKYQECKGFYNSKVWQDCRNSYKKSRHGLCEKCLEQGIYRPSEIVHHKTPVTPFNMNDPNITLNWDNLECLCREHHAEVHGTREKRYKVDDLGRIITE